MRRNDYIFTLILFDPSDDAVNDGLQVDHRRNDAQESTGTAFRPVGCQW